MKQTPPDIAKLQMQTFVQENKTAFKKSPGANYFFR